jgi:hypothetical protein
MSIRTAKSSHLGERRFHEYPQIGVEDWGVPSEFAQRSSPRQAGRPLLSTCSIALQKRESSSGVV